MEGMKTNPRVKVLKQLVADGQYVIDQGALAEAMTLRAMVLRMLPDVSFRGGARAEPPVVSLARAHRWARALPLAGAHRCARALPLWRP